MNGRISAEKKSGPRAGTLKGEIERKIRDHDPTCAGGAKSSSRTRPPSTALDETTMAAAAIMAPGVLLKAATTVGVFLVAIATAVALAHKCTPSQRQIEAEEREKLSRSLRAYVQRGEFTVRFE